MNDEAKLVYSKILNSKTNTTPFEFMVIDNLFSKNYYKQLSNEFYNLDLKKFNIKNYFCNLRPCGKFRNAIEIYNNN